MPLNLQTAQQFSGLEFMARQVVEGFITGLHKSPMHGFSVEFAEHRQYNKGESTRHIDWKLYARTGKLFSKRYEEETNLRCQIVIDVSSSMNYSGKPEGGDDKLSFAANAAAALIYLLRKQRDAVGLTLFSDEVRLHTQAKSSPAHHKMLFATLEDTVGNRQKKHSTAAVEAIHLIAESIHKRSLVIIFSDLLDSHASLDEIFNGLQHLRHNKHEVILFNVLDKATELEFNFENRPYIFEDLETGEEIKLNAASVKNSYTKRMNELKHELRLRCLQHKIDLVDADIAAGFDQVLHAFLIKREINL